MTNSNNSFSKTYLKGEFSYGFWNVVMKFLAALNSIIIISALTLYEYGSFQLLLASYASLAVFLGVGGGVIINDIIRFESEGRVSDAKKLFLELAFIKIGVGVVLFFLTFTFPSSLPLELGPAYINIIRILSFLFIHDAISGTIITLLTLRKKFNTIASRQSIAKAAQLAFLVGALIFYHMDLKVVVLSLVISMFVTLIALIQPLIESWKPWQPIRASKGSFFLKIMSTHGKWGLGQPVLGKIASFIETWSIKLFINTEAVAIYSIAQSLIGVINSFLPIKTLSTLVPMEIENDDRIRKIYTYGTKYVTIFSIGMAAVAFLVFPIIVDIFFDKYLVSVPYFKLLLITVPISAVIQVASIFLVVFRRQGFLFFQKVLKIITATPLYFLLLPAFGLWGLVLHNYLILLIMAVLLYIYMRRIKPRLFIRISELFAFGLEDKVFLQNIFRDVVSYIKRMVSA